VFGHRGDAHRRTVRVDHARKAVVIDHAQTEDTFIERAGTSGVGGRDERDEVGVAESVMRTAPCRSARGTRAR
jgi:hypothetical protein